MKTFLAIIIVAVVCLVVFNYLTTGEFKLIPSSNVSPEEVELMRLSDEFDALEREYRQAGRGAAFGGVDTTGDVSSIFSEMDEIEKKVKKIAKEGSTMEVRGKAKKVLEGITQFKLDSR
ncbi:MAG: hypothetical protein K8R59_08245 [Thermoanaerobaculales bacterium]|nr:hypothetical protein [Thermoanaerobaculales bacterium]